LTWLKGGFPARGRASGSFRLIGFVRERLWSDIAPSEDESTFNDGFFSVREHNICSSEPTPATRHLSQAELGQMIGVQGSQIDKIERGTSTLVVGRVRATCKALGITPDVLPGVDDNEG
jgi:DNA-binding Xre family transcriptional regulator